MYGFGCKTLSVFGTCYIQQRIYHKYLQWFVREHVQVFSLLFCVCVCFVWDLINKSSNVTIKQQRANETKCRNKAISSNEREKRKRLVQNISHRLKFTQKWRVKNGKFIHNSTYYGFIGFFWAHLAYYLQCSNFITLICVVFYRTMVYMFSSVMENRIQKNQHLNVRYMMLLLVFV